MPIVISGTNGISGVDGTASNPSYEGTDSNTGIFFPAADTVAIGTGGSERVRVDSVGNLVVGTTSSLSSAANRIDITVNGTSSSMVSWGTGGTRRGYLIHDATDFTIASETAGAVRFLNNGAERMRINAGAPILCLAGGNTSATGTGIAFPATQSASSDANTLDDYEEGTFDSSLGIAYSTPGTSSITYGIRSGTYTKIGRVVYFTIDVRILTFSKGTASGGLFVTGLPFAQRATGGQDSARFTVQLYDWTYTTSPIIASVLSSSTSIAIERMVSNAVTTNIDDPRAGSIIWITGFYFV